MIKLEEQLYGYKFFFSEFESEVVNPNNLIAFKTVSYALETQFSNVKSPSCIKSIETKLERLIRGIKAEFDYVNRTFENYYFPDFVLDIAETEVRGYLSSYHLSIVSLLKLLVIIIDERKNENDVYEFVLNYSAANLVADRPKVLFSGDGIQSGTDDSGFEGTALKQLDIDLRNFF